MFELFYSKTNLRNFIRWNINSSNSLFTYWAEHCTECTVPTCYTSCNLYKNRGDISCRRFKQGIVHMEGDAINIGFNKWAKLETRISNISVVQRPIQLLLNLIHFYLSFFLEKLNQTFISRISRRNLTWLYNQTIYFLQRKYKLRLRLNENLVFSSRLKVDRDCVLVLSLLRKGAQIFSCDFRLDANRVEDISVCIPRNISLAADSICLFFKSSEIEVDVSIFDLGLIKTKQSLQPKLFIWDLDNTLWDGVLIEDKEKIQLREEFIDYIKFLDSIGVQNSICSKNDINEVKIMLERFQIFEYFNFIEISWNPKSTSIKRIIDNYNFLPNQVFFIDDNVFERIEVELAIDGLNVLSDFELIQNKHSFDYFEDSMGSERRKKYSIEQSRKSEAIIDNSSDGIESYLKKLKIKISLKKLSKFSSRSILERCFDLLQRTNQLNLKTVRYNRENFSDLISDSEIDNYSFEVADTFGSYGIVGFLSLRGSNNELDLINLVISCRIAEKHIEEDVLYYLILKNYEIYNKLNINLLKTDRNGKLQNLLKNSKCVIVNENDKEISYTLSSEHINYTDLINEVVIIE